MTVTDLLAGAWQIAVQTASYLLAYLGVLVLAPAAHLALVALGPARRGWLGPRWGVAGAAGAALTRPLSRRSLESGLRSTTGPAATVAYLAVFHALTVSSWILLGPLLGKDFLLSHVVGVVLFGLFAAGLARLLGVLPAGEAAPGGEGARAGGDRRRPARGAGEGGFRGLPALLGISALRYAALVVLGLALGGLVGAWGLSPGGWAPAELGGSGPATQVVNGLLGLGLALVGIAPVANLFVGTYLWKVGLAHAGIVAFFCAAPAAPTRWRLYARTFGRAGAVRLVAALLAAALLAGLVTAWLFGAAGIEIRYKLTSEQLWEVR